MNVVIAGDHDIALSLIEALMQKHRVVYVGPRPPGSGKLDRLDVETVLGAITSSESLKLAHVGDCDTFIACSRNDEQNIVACLAAQGLGAPRTTCVLMRSGFLNIGGNDDALAETLGITEVVRGEDLLVSTARQLLLYRVLGWSAPAFYHCPLVRDEDRRRLAKRDQARSIASYREQGMAPEELRRLWGAEEEDPGR